MTIKKKLKYFCFNSLYFKTKVKSNAKEEKMSQQQQSEVEKQHTEVEKQSALSNEIKDLIFSGFCTDWSIQNYHKKSNNAFQKIKELLGAKTNTLSSKEIEDL